MESNEYEQYDAFVIAQPDQQIEDDDADQKIDIIETDGKRQLVGYAVVWGAISSVRRDGFRHRFAKGSITWATPTLALWEHDFASPLASTGNTTLTVVEDDYGAKVTIDLDDTTDGTNAWTRVKNRLVTGMSFGGLRLAYDRTTDPKVIDVTSFICKETSLTIIPAMTETNIVTAAQSDNLQKNIQVRKENVFSMQKQKLDTIRLALLKPTGKVSA